MKKISFGIILPFLIIFLLASCVTSPSVSIEQKPDIKPQVVEQPRITPQIVEQPVMTPKKPDSNAWEHLGKTRSGDCYYNKASVSKSSHVIEVRTYKIVTQDFRKAAIEEVKKNDPANSIKYHNYDHNVRVDEIDCQKNLYRVTESIDYDVHGNVLDHFRYANEPWRSIPVLTGLDTLRGKFCIVQKQPLNKNK